MSMESALFQHKMMVGAVLNNYYPLKGKSTQGVNTTVTKINKYLRKLPETQCDGFSFLSDLDCILGDLVNDVLTLKSVKKQIKKKVLGYVPSKKLVYEWKCKFIPVNISNITELHPDILFFNDMQDKDILKYSR